MNEASPILKMQGHLVEGDLPDKEKPQSHPGQIHRMNPGETVADVAARVGGDPRNFKRLQKSPNPHCWRCKGKGFTQKKPTARKRICICTKH